MNAALRAESRRRFPTWSRRARARWVLARIKAATLPPRVLMPWTIDQQRWTEAQFAPRTLKEARIT